MSSSSFSRRRRTARHDRRGPVPPRPNRSGIHLLNHRHSINELIRSADVGAGDLVIDFGAGPGTITAPLADTGARVMAVERDERFVRTLRQRFSDQPRVRVVHADLRQVPLPRGEFFVVASVPFSVSTPLLRRLLTLVPSGLAAADIVVEWGLAKRLTASQPRDLEAAWWVSRYDIQLRHRIPARHFTPAPQVDAAHLTIRRLSTIDVRAQAILWRILEEVYRRPAAPARQVLRSVTLPRRPHRFGIDPAQPASEVPIRCWTELARVLAADRSVAIPPLPRDLRRPASNRSANRPPRRLS